jgi:flagellin-like hook-associated protein FlgL
LQSTAALLATTQNDLATGNKVNTALDNPTEFFTAAGLNNRASDIGNLLDSIGNGVQVLQAANTGITSLQSLIANAQSIANQVLQTPVGYSTKSSITSAAITGANANNLLGTGTAAASGTVTAAAFTPLNVSGTGAAATAAAPDTGTGFVSPVDLSGANTASFTLNVDGTSKSITLNTAAVAAFTTAGGTISGTNATLTATDISKIIDYQFNNADTTGAGPVTVSGGQLSIASSTTGTSSQVTISGLTQTGVTTGLANVSHTGAAATSADSETFTVTVDGGAAKTITLDAAHVATYDSAKSATANAASLSANDVANIINFQYDPSGATTVASVVGGKLTFTSGTTGTGSTVATSAVTGTATAGTTGITAATNTGTAAVAGSLQGETLTVAATGSGTPTNITFGTGANQISTLNQLNAALAPNNLQANISTTGVITIVTSNDAASSTIGALGGTAFTTSGSVFSAASATDPVLDPVSQATRTNLVAQYNNVLQQINTTAQDSSFNGINLLNGDTLNLVFDETGASKLAITGVTFNDAGLGLSNLTAGKDFLDSDSANGVLSQLQAASTTLRGEASALGSNLSIVEIRQDFNKNLINVLQTGASNLTLADPNEEAANSQALSTRQSIAVSALALANQSQQSVLQLLR